MHTPFEDFGAKSSDKDFDNADAMNWYNDYIYEHGMTTLLLKPEIYHFKNAPKPFDRGIPPDILGYGANSSNLVRDYLGAGGIGFIQQTGCTGGRYRHFTISYNDKGGDLLNIKSTNRNGGGGNWLENIVFSSFGSNTGKYGRALVIDGRENNGGLISRGCRSNQLIGVKVYGPGDDCCVELRACHALSWTGGYFQGPKSVGLRIIGSEYFSPSGINIDLSHCSGDIVLVYALDVLIRAASGSGEIIKDGNSDRCSIVLGSNLMDRS